MSKYGRMRNDTPGLTQWLVQETATDHDATMDHPFMKTVYQRKVDPTAYAVYLASQQLIFSAMETAASTHAQHATIAPMSQPSLDRSDALSHDLDFFIQSVLPLTPAAVGNDNTSDPPDRVTPTPSARRYVEVLRADVAENADLLAVHRMLQYLAVLSGGQYLKTQLSKQLAGLGVASPTDGLTFYSIPTVPIRDTSKFVGDYMDRIDALPFTVPRDRLLTCAQQVYALSLELMSECYALNPVPLDADTHPPTMAPGTSELRLSLAQLAQYDGVQNDRIILSIAGKLYDVTSGRAMYGPDGSYAKFAGHDVTRALGAMDLSSEALNDLVWQPANDKQAKTLADWEKKLGAKYPVCGTLTTTNDDDVSVGAPPSATTSSRTAPHGGAATNASTCPFSGVAASTADGAASCPFSTSSSSVAAASSATAAAGTASSKDSAGHASEGECPWPFVFLHDPKLGLHAKHRTKNLAVCAAIVAGTASLIQWFA
eukprot:m.170060 g.170060  ORF g.170060 m.170060 type:complete len:486 (-) comp13189_c0_seq1:106-1563(-)